MDTTKIPEIAWNLNLLLQSRGWTYADLAKATGLHWQTCFRLKSRKVMPRRLDSYTLALVCVALGCTPGDLMHLEKKSPKRKRKGE